MTFMGNFGKTGIFSTSDSRDMDTTAICTTTQASFTKRTAGSHVPPHEDGTSEQPQQVRRQQAHQTTLLDNTSQGTDQ